MVKDLVEYVFNTLNLDYEKYVKTDKKFERAEELHYLKGDATKARKILGWEPEYTFETMIDEMIEYWLKKLKNELV
jgi:GDPmannose 4,6-dehydratase